LRLFAQSRGYAVVANFSQYIKGQGSDKNKGFTFADFQSEIDAGRPVLIQLEGHTMLGYGYNTSGQVVYMHDAWDRSPHQMTWGGLYQGYSHLAVTVIQLKAAAAPNSPPNVPSSPSPANHAAGVSLDADLSWTGGDPDAGDTVTYDVYFGTGSSLPKVSGDQSACSYDPGTLNGNTKYYWKIVARDNHQAYTIGPLWDFTTGPAPNSPPNTPSNPSPANHATGGSIDADLSWTGGDPDPGDSVSYDVYFGTGASLPKVSGDQSATSHDPGMLSYNTKYYWRIVATDNHGAQTTGPLWDFTTVNPPGPAELHVGPGQDYATIQEAIDAASDGDSIIVHEGTYDAFTIESRNNINIIGEGAVTVNSGKMFAAGAECWVMALVMNSTNINIDSIVFDGGEIEVNMLEGIAYSDSTGSIAGAAVRNITGSEMAMGVCLWGQAQGSAAVDISDLTVENCIIGVMVGIPQEYEAIYGIPDERPSTMQMTGCTISHNNTGIYVDDDGDLIANCNSIAGNNAIGVYKQNPPSVDASNNWWGDASGPEDGSGDADCRTPGEGGWNCDTCDKNDGAGDKVSDNVDYCPWLLGPAIAWDFPSTSGVFIGPTPANGRPYLGATVPLPTGTEPEQLSGVYWLDEATGDWQYFVPGFMLNTLTSLEPGKNYLTAVSGPCSWNLPCGEGTALPAGNIWSFPSVSNVFLCPTPASGRPYLDGAVSLPTQTEPAQLSGVYWLDEAAGDWQYFIPGFTLNTLTSLEPGQAYLVAVSGPCSWSLP
jgi:hypothetical protein